MAKREMLVTLGSCLKQSRKEVYDVLDKAAEISGRNISDPDGVYEDVMKRLMAFHEPLGRRQARLDKKWSSDEPKGRRTAQQFQPIFEKLTLDLDAAGIWKSDTDKYLGYLRRLPATLQLEV